MTYDPNAPNPYTCRLLRRLDAVIWRVRGREVFWTRDGYLCELMPRGHGVELATHFPGAFYTAAAWVQNRWLWTRKVLSW
jgi:hypothetical protein